MNEPTPAPSPNGVLNGALMSSTSVTPTNLVGGADTAMLMALLQRVASDPTVDLDRMERLFGMIQTIEVKRAESAYAAAMAAAQAKLVPVLKNQSNTQTHSRYADLAAIVEACMPIINGLGFGISASECPPKDSAHLGVRLEVTHSGGCTKIYDFQVPLDGAGFKGAANKTGTHAYGSTFSYGRRYGICGVFNIATKDDTDGNAKRQKGAAADGDNATVGEEQLGELDELIKRAGITFESFLRVHKIETVTDMTVRDFKRAKHTLLERIKNNAAKAKNDKGAA